MRPKPGYSKVKMLTFRVKARIRRYLSTNPMSSDVPVGRGGEAKKDEGKNERKREREGEGERVRKLEMEGNWLLKNASGEELGDY